MGGSKGQGILTGSSLGRHTCVECAHSRTHHIHACSQVGRVEVLCTPGCSIPFPFNCLVLASSAQSDPWKSGSLEVKHHHEPPGSIALKFLDLFLENLLKPYTWMVWDGG